MNLFIMKLLRIPIKTFEIVLFLDTNHRKDSSCCVLAHKHTSLCHLCLPPSSQQSVNLPTHLY